MIKEYRIYPAIGISRVGNSETDYFIGPESPGIAPLGAGPYKSNGKIKRQGARFRIYEYQYDDDQDLVSIEEITAAQATIEWHVTLTNRKAEAAMFPPYRGLGRRNVHITADRATKLIISAEECISGTDIGFGTGWRWAVGYLLCAGFFGLMHLWVTKYPEASKGVAH